jgi:hypothetical protein
MRFAAFAVFTFSFFTAAAVHPADMSAGSNFVVLAPNRAVADAVAAQAEIYRAKAAQEWLGEKLPERQGRTLINVEIDTQKDEGATWPIDCKERTLHQVWLSTSLDRALGSTLRHEVVHTVLDTHFYPEAPPAWASEGIASQSDDAGRQKNQRELLSQWSTSGRWPSFRQLFATQRIGHEDLQAYALAASVTEFLCERSGKRHVVEFAAAGRKNGWDQAAHDSFGVRDVAELQSAWQTWATARTAR